MLECAVVVVVQVWQGRDVQVGADVVVKIQQAKPAAVWRVLATLTTESCPAVLLPHISCAGGTCLQLRAPVVDGQENTWCCSRTNGVLHFLLSRLGLNQQYVL